MLLIFVITTWWLDLPSCLAVNKPTITIALMLESQNSSLLDVGHFYPAFNIGVEEVNNGAEQHEYGFRLNHILRETGVGCGKNGLYASAIAAEMFLNTTLNVNAIFGPLCYAETTAVADLASYWNVPMFTVLDTTNPGLQNKNRYKTLVRMSHSSGEEADFLYHIFLKYDWQHGCAMLWDTKNYEWADLLENIKESFEDDGIVFEKVVVADYDNPETAVVECQKHARIIIMAFGGHHVRDVMLKAFDLGLVYGDYVFIALNTKRSGNLLDDEHWKQNDGRDNDAKTAYASLFWIRLYEPHTLRYQDFLRKIGLQSQTQYHLDEGDFKQVEYALAGFHDAVILYAHAINETLARDGDIQDGYQLVQSLSNRDFKLHYGIFSHVTINGNLDREADYTLWDMTQVDCGEFSEVMNFLGLSRRLEITGDIVWPLGATGPPSSTPFTDTTKEKWVIVLAVAIPTVAFVLFCGLMAVMHRYKKVVAELNAQKTHWRISFDELTFVSTNSWKSGTSISSEKSWSHKVVVKTVNKEKLHLSSTVIKELKANRLAEHENLARFYGVCVDQSLIGAVHQYCPRGSLKDFLQSGKVEADIKDILMIDLAKGVNYLHNSPVGVHGRLHWNNCVIDSRFVLQLTDFGLYEFRLGENIDDVLSPEYLNKMLWASPEHLRNKYLRPTQKADIYAVGLLLQVIVTGTQPYDQSNIDINPEHILEKVKFNTAPYFRPVVPETLCRERIRYCMQNCWQEEPIDRPIAKEVLALVKRGKKVLNIVDQLLNRMEKYANKLEALVEERTEAFLEEKKKAVNLLYEVLPRCVAEQLMEGTYVEPESYTDVTICFSDLVQFTEMSSESTPMEVIGLLNNLFSAFDEILKGFDVYKVETIGDAYMVASGLPIRNGTLHVREIGSMALSLIAAVSNIKGIGNKFDESIQLRVGIHTGSCVAGVVGHTMPRYCLFGDTVNTASRMESSGEAQRIHISQQTKTILDTFNHFETELRGEMEIKGKGRQITYWLLGERISRIATPRQTSDSGRQTTSPSRAPSSKSIKSNRSSLKRQVEILNNSSTTQ